MSDMLKAGLIRSLAAAPITRAQAPRDTRTESGFGAQLDAARDSIRENRELERSQRSDSRDPQGAVGDAAPVDEADAPKSPRNDESTPTGDAQDATAESGLIIAPIVVVTIAGPLAPVSESSDEASLKLPVAEAAKDITIEPSSGDAPAVEKAASSQIARDVGEHGPVAALLHPPVDATVETTRDNRFAYQHLPPKAVQSEPDVVNADASTPQTERDAVSERVANRSQSPADTGRRGDATPDAKLESGAFRAVQQATVGLRGEAGVDHTHAQQDGESIRDVRVADAMNRALHGESKQSARDGASHRAGAPQQLSVDATIPQALDASRSLSQANDLSGSDLITRATGASEIEGDSGAAAAIGKFLAGVSTSVEPIKSSGRESGDGAGRSHQQSSQTSAHAGAANSSVGSAKAQAGLTSPLPAGATFSQILSTRLDPASSMESTARVLAAHGGSGRHQVTLRLSPAELGELRLDVRMEAGAMTLRVDADNAAAGRLIESRLGELREALSAHGISIERADVVVRGDASANGGFEHRSASDDPTARQQSAHGDAREGSWNFNEGHAFTGGDRSGRSDDNPWWMRGETLGSDTTHAERGPKSDDRSVIASLQNGSLDLVA